MHATFLEMTAAILVLLVRPKSVAVTSCIAATAATAAGGSILAGGGSAGAGCAAVMWHSWLPDHHGSRVPPLLLSFRCRRCLSFCWKMHAVAGCAAVTRNS
jgi:hypothetical protein